MLLNLTNLHRKQSTTLAILLTIGISAVLGILALFVPIKYIAVLFAGIIYILLLKYVPEIALLTIFVLMSTLLDIYELPSISIGFGHLIITDLVLFGAIGILIFDLLLDRKKKLYIPTSGFLLILFYISALFSTFLALSKSLTTFNQSLGEIRVVNTYLLFFIVIYFIRDKYQVKRLVLGIFALALIVGIAMLVQFQLGDTIQILPGRVENVNVDKVVFEGITRILPPGQSLVMAALIAVFIIEIACPGPSPRVISIIGLVITGAAIVLSFNRSFWLCAICIYGAALLIFPRDQRQRIILYTFWGIVLIGVGLFVLRFVGESRLNQLVDAFYTRMISIFQPKTVNESSIQDRVIEIQYAWKSIRQHPLLGIGLGTEYRPYDPRIDGSIDSWSKRGYVHNGHLWLITKIGIVGYIFLMWAMITSALKGLRNWRKIEEPFFKGCVLAFSLLILGGMIIAVFNPIYYQTFWVPVLVTMLGLIEIILQFLPDRKQTGQHEPAR